jgi:hypothetical protein
MIARHAFIRHVVTLLTLTIGGVDFALAAGPLLVTGNGTVARWGPGSVPYHPDLGPLGLLDNATAVADVAANFAVWESVPTAAMTAASAGPLTEDVTTDNVFDFFVACDGLSPIIFDTDGSIIDLLLGNGASATILGVAGLECAEEGASSS